MEPHPLATYTTRLIEEHGVPFVLDVENSIKVHKPLLTGSDSPASYYIRPPSGMSAEAFIEWFESIPGYRDFKLTLVPILGLDTFHQPLISADDFARKHFHDNQLRIVRVVGKSNSAIEAMTAFVEALKLPFDAKHFPQHKDFSVSRYRTAEMGGATEVKLLYKPADYNALMKVERLVSVHLDEFNLGQEIGASRHSTRTQPPELILISVNNIPTGVAFLQALVESLPIATPEEVVEATERAQSSSTHSQTDTTSSHARFSQPEVPTLLLPPEELKKKVLASLAEVLKVGNFANGVGIKVVHGGTTIEIKFPRSIGALWLTTTYRESQHIKQVANFCMGVRTDPVLREGWLAVYHYDSSAGKLHIRASDADSDPPSGWKSIPR